MTTSSATRGGGELRRFGLFLATSGTSVVVNLVLRYALSGILAFEAAVAVAYVFSTAVAFVLARAFVFEAGPQWRAELARFLLVNLIGFVQVLAIGALLVRTVFPAIGLVWHPEEIAHFLALASLALTSFELHRRFSFRTART